VLAHAGRGDADLLTLRLDGDLAAFAVCLRSGGGELYVYSNYVSPRWLDHSAGTIANAEVVRYAFAQPGLTGVDWAPGPQRYKLSRAELRRTQHVQAWSSPTVRRVLPTPRKLAALPPLRRARSAAGTPAGPPPSDRIEPATVI
jgi:CelD/BcsL family acetyltransferase involved in cellulose biosynthesis